MVDRSFIDFLPNYEREGLWPPGGPKIHDFPIRPDHEPATREEVYVGVANGGIAEYQDGTLFVVYLYNNQQAYKLEIKPDGTPQEESIAFGHITRPSSMRPGIHRLLKAEGLPEELAHRISEAFERLPEKPVIRVKRNLSIS